MLQVRKLEVLQVKVTVLQVKGDKGDESLVFIYRFLMVLGQSIIRIEAGSKEMDRLRSRKANRERDLGSISWSMNEASQYHHLLILE